VLAFGPELITCLSCCVEDPTRVAL
jgi:hypothetical protein